MDKDVGICKHIEKITLHVYSGVDNYLLEFIVDPAEESEISLEVVNDCERKSATLRFPYIGSNLVMLERQINKT